MKRAVLVALALAACKKDAPPPATPEHVADDASAELTCEDVVKNPVIEAQPEHARMFLELCNGEPARISQPLRRCLRDATSDDALDACSDEHPPDEGEPKRSEAELSLDAIKKGAKAYYAETGSFPAGSAPLTPLDSCCDSGRSDRKCEPDAALWASGDPDAPFVWDLLVFGLDEPHYFRYAYEGDGASFTALAVGDLDCDEAFATYTLEAKVGEGGPVFELTKPDRVD